MKGQFCWQTGQIEKLEKALETLKDTYEKVLSRAVVSEEQVRLSLFHTHSLARSLSPSGGQYVPRINLAPYTRNPQPKAQHTWNR